MTEPIDRPDPDGPEAAPPKRRGGGPRTPEGKERSKRNALKHGLRAKLLLPDELALRLERRTEEVHLEYNPRTPHQENLLADVARCLVLIERCAELAVADRGRVAVRADDAWDDDRRLEVERLGAKLAQSPGPIAEALSQTRHGADWLIRHWHGLAVAARVAGRWDDAQRQLAFDLLGTPAALRATSDELPAAEAPGEELAAFAEGWVEGLRRARAEYLDERDEREREEARTGMPVKEDATSRRLRLYEASLRRSLRWALDEFRRVRGELVSAPRSGRRREEPVRRGLDLPPWADLDLLEFAAEGEPAEEPEPEPMAPAPAESPVLAAAPSPPKPMNRRARKAMEKRQRLAAKRDGR